MKTISRNKLKAMIDAESSFHLIEVLKPDQYERFHLPGAINVPMDDQFESTIRTRVPNQSDTIVVYCKDESCPASRKAAEKLDAMGYTNVMDYEAGKEDWKQAGLPIEEPAGASRS